MVLTSRPSNYNLRSVPEQQQQLQQQQQQHQNQQPAQQVGSLQQQPEQQQVQQHIFPFNSVPSGMAGLYNLENFKGDCTQDIVSYLKRFDQYCLCTGLKDERAMATLALHLTENAQIWFKNLTTPPTTIDALKTMLQEKYKRCQQIDLEVYNMKQLSYETVETFLNRLEAQTIKGQVPNNVQVQIALSGMDRSLGTAISTHAPSSLDDIRKLLQRMNFRQPEVNVATILNKLETTVEALSAQVAKLTVAFENQMHQQNERQRQQYEQQEFPSYCNSRLEDDRPQSNMCRRCGAPSSFLITSKRSRQAEKEIYSFKTSYDRPHSARIRLERRPKSSKSTVITEREKKRYDQQAVPARHRQPSIVDDDSSSSEEDTLKAVDSQRQRNKQQHRRSHIMPNGDSTPKHRKHIDRENKEMSKFISVLDNTLQLNKEDDKSEEEELQEVKVTEETPRIPKSSSMPSVDTLCNADRLMARIKLLHEDCIKGVGWPVLRQAYEILGRIEEDEVEPKLVALMGKDNFDLYAGKIWQLKFCEDMARIGIPS